MSDQPHVTALDLDLLALGRLSPEHVARIEAHSAACPACAARKTEHGEHVQHFRSRVFPRTAAHLAEHRRPRLPWRWLLGLAVPVTAGVLLLVHSQAKPPVAGLEAPRDQGTFGIKGSFVRVFARRNRPNTGDVVAVYDGDRLAAGDALRFVLLPSGLRYVLIASIDGAGQANIYYPFRGEASGEVDPKGTVSVPGSIVLDQAPGPERLFFIHSERPIQAQAVRELLVELGAGGAPMIRGARRLPLAGTVQSTLLFEKEEAR